MKNKISFKSAKKILCKLLKAFYKMKTKEKGIKVTMGNVGNDETLFEVKINHEFFQNFLLKKEEIKTLIANLDKRIEDLNKKSEVLEQIPAIADKLQSLEDDNNSKLSQIPLLESEIKELKGDIKKLKDKEKELETSKSELEKENSGLKKELNTELLELYKKLPEEFHSAFSYIKANTKMNFLITSGDKNTIIQLYENIKNRAKKGENIQSFKEFFDALFVVHKEIYGLERLEASNELNESLHIDITSKSRGQIEETIFIGFKDGKQVYKSIVKVKG